MSSNTLPVGAEAKNIGKVVTVQVFKRETNAPETLRLETLEKHVGVLQTYHHNSQGFTFCLVGGARVTSTYKSQYVEIHLSPLVQSNN